MTWIAEKYARALWEMGMPAEKMRDALTIYESEPLLGSMLEDPTLFRESKERIIKKIFPEEVQNVVMMLCTSSEIDHFAEIVEAYQIYANEHNRVVNAKLRYVTAPDEKQKESLIQFLKNETGLEAVDLQMKQDESLLGGFILEADGKSYDWSLRGRFQLLKNQIQNK